MGNIELTEHDVPFSQRAVIKVCGVGGGGGNAVGRMIESGLRDVEFISINTDAQALRHSPAQTRIQIGGSLAGGLGAGARPDVGYEAALEDRERILDALKGADMVFLTAGLGGGTGTGACPVAAEVAREVGALTVAIVTLPFAFEGPERMMNAIKGLAALEQQVDTLIVVPNDRVAELQQNVSLKNAFRAADEVLNNGVRAISELITVPGVINLDFADVRTIMKARGRALMGIGTAEGEDRAVHAANEAIVCPLLEQSSIQGAKGVIVNVRGGQDLMMNEVQKAAATVQAAAHPDANIIVGVVLDDNDRAELQVTVIAAGFDGKQSAVSAASSFGADAAPPFAPKPARAPEIAPKPAIASGYDAPASVAATSVEPDDEPKFSAPPKPVERSREESAPAFVDMDMPVSGAPGVQEQFFDNTFKDEAQSEKDAEKSIFDIPTFMRRGRKG